MVDPPKKITYLSWQYNRRTHSSAGITRKLMHKVYTRCRPPSTIHTAPQRTVIVRLIQKLITVFVSLQVIIVHNRPSNNL